jgi:hypothetical protein
LATLIWTRYKAVLESERAKGNDRTIVVRIDCEMYRLVRLDMATDEMHEAMKRRRFNWPVGAPCTSLMLEQVLSLIAS